MGSLVAGIPTLILFFRPPFSRYALEALSVNEVSGGLLITDTLSGVKVQVNAQLIMQLLFGFKPDAYYR